MTESMTHAGRPTDAVQLHRWLRKTLDLTLPRAGVIEGHAAPFAYLEHAYFRPESRPTDSVVWANRGGGKTFLGAIATALDLIFKPGIEVRVLAGSLEQASRHAFAPAVGLRARVARVARARQSYREETQAPERIGRRAALGESGFGAGHACAGLAGATRLICLSLRSGTRRSS